MVCFWVCNQNACGSVWVNGIDINNQICGVFKKGLRSFKGVKVGTANAYALNFYDSIADGRFRYFCYPVFKHARLGAY